MNTYITRINGLSIGERTQHMQYMVAEIAHQLGIREMGIYRYNGANENTESLNARIDGIIAGINRGDLVICQFPTGNGLRFEWALVNHLKAYGGRIAIFIHDLEPLFNEKMRSTLWEVVNLYNQAEILIVPSLAMRQFLLENRIRKDMKFVIQEMWDYTIGMNFFGSPKFRREIHFTVGDGFVGMDDWNYALSLKVYTASAEQRQKVQYMGALPSGELVSALSKGGFGLVWYQDENSRQRMEYSVSFDLARYLSAGIPVIVPIGISNQTVIEKNHLGLVVNSLDEAAATIEAMTELEYQGYVQSVGRFAQILRNGYYTKKCLIDAVQAVHRNDAGEISTPVKVYDLGECIFTFAVLKESYAGNLALSWNYHGKMDGFLIYDASGKVIYETRDVHQHYFLIKGWEKDSSFIIKAYVDTLRGKMVVAESETVCLQAEKYDHKDVSIIIPAYNAEDYIIRTIDTALAQSLYDLEIIIVDDGSTDHTPEIIDWYAEKYSNVVVIHKENGGVAAARNTGIEYAGGEYIGFMDNDDMIHPEMITRLYHSVKKNDCDIAVTSVYQIKNSGYEAFVQYPMEEDTAITIEEFFEMHFTKGCMFAVVIWNKLYRASLVKSHLIPVMIADDNAWTPYILSYADKVCYLNDCSYEWDRKIRSSTQVDQWLRRTKDELFHMHKNAIMFYLTNGNPRRRELLKQLARRQLSELKRAYAYDEYEELWKQIEVIF